MTALIQIEISWKNGTLFIAIQLIVIVNSLWGITMSILGNTTITDSNYAGKGKVGSQLVTKIYNYDDISSGMDRILQHICIPPRFEKRKQRRKNSTREIHRCSVRSGRIPHRYLGVFYLHMDRIIPTFRTPHLKLMWVVSAFEPIEIFCSKQKMNNPWVDWTVIS